MAAGTDVGVIQPSVHTPEENETHALICPAVGSAVGSINVMEVDLASGDAWRTNVFPFVAFSNRVRLPAATLGPLYEVDVALQLLPSKTQPT